MIEDKIKYYLEKLNLSQFMTYFDNTIYLFLIFGFLFVCLFLLFLFLFKGKRKTITQNVNIKPNLEEIINKIDSKSVDIQADQISQKELFDIP